MNKRLLKLAEQIKDNWTLCELFDGTGRASEKEMIIAQTIHACRINLQTEGKAFSYDEVPRGSSGGGLVDNGTAIGWLIGEGYLATGGSHPPRNC